MKNQRIPKVLVPCPLAGAHKVDEERLKSHLWKCTVTRDKAFEACQPFVLHGCNCREQPDPKKVRVDGPTAGRRQAATLDTDAVEALGKTVDAAYEKCLAYLGCENLFLEETLPEQQYALWRVLENSESVCKRSGGMQLVESVRKAGRRCGQSQRRAAEKLSLSAESVKSEYADADGASEWEVMERKWEGSLAGIDRHDIQNLALLAHCLEKGFLAKGSSDVVIEFGAGRAALTWWLMYLYDVDNEENEIRECPRFVVVEREKRRLRREVRCANYLEKNGRRENLAARLRTDIADFDFSRFLKFAHSPKSDPTLWRSYRIPPILHELFQLGVNWIPHLDPSQERMMELDALLKLEESELQESKLAYSCVRRLAQGCTPVKVVEENLLSVFAEGWKWSGTALCVAKHLCGDGTDIALRAIVRAADANPEKDVCLAIAPCCHQRCNIDGEMVGSEFIKEHLGFSGSFPLLTSVAGWGTGAIGRKREIGMKVKRILDGARVWWLRQNGFEASVHVNVAAEVSLENVVILASRRSVVCDKGATDPLKQSSAAAATGESSKAKIIDEC